MSSSASERYAIRPAPSGLVLVQELLNTASAGRPSSVDLLAELDTAQHWLDRAVALWAEWTDATPGDVRVTLEQRDLGRLRALRGQLRASVAGAETAGRVAGSLGLSSTGDGTITVHPRGEGVGWVTSAVLGESWLARHDDTWRRLKLCRNEVCDTAFYDRSRNNSGVWHDVHVCGNAANLRASRARRRTG